MTTNKAIGLAALIPDFIDERTRTIYILSQQARGEWPTDIVEGEEIFDTQAALNELWVFYELIGDDRVEH